PNSSSRLTAASSSSIHKRQQRQQTAPFVFPLKNRTIPTLDFRFWVSISFSRRLAMEVLGVVSFSRRLAMEINNSDQQWRFWVSFSFSRRLAMEINNSVATIKGNLRSLCGSNASDEEDLTFPTGSSLECYSSGSPSYSLIFGL
ncbi:hypothetical protein AABB24_038479, partial [Solanum stoloniferum]